MVRMMNQKRNVKVTVTTGAASLVERVGGLACKLVWATAVVAVLVLVARVVMAG